MAAIIGKKLGMTQVFAEDGTRVPVTVIEAGPCPVTAVRDADRDGYAAVQLAFGEVPERKLTKPELGHLKKAGAPPASTLVEFRDTEDERRRVEIAGMAGIVEVETGVGRTVQQKLATSRGDRIRQRSIRQLQPTGPLGLRQPSANDLIRGG